MTIIMNRRQFIGTAGGGLLLLKPQLVRGSSRNSAVRTALFGCGGRGTGVAQSFTEHTGAHYIALGDLFQEQTERAQKAIGQTAEKAGKTRIDAAMLFHGPDSLARIAALKDVDMIHVATPPYFHPDHLDTAVDAGKHVYLEKPVAVDVPGSKRVIRAGERARPSQSIAVGFQLRHATPYVQLVERVKSGQIGELLCGLSHYYAGANTRPEWPNATPNERRLRNWIHDRVLSGDILVEQNIHLIDVNNWILGARPLSAQGTGGRKGRRDQGDCWSHYNVHYTYPGDIHITVTSTQFLEGSWDVAMRYFGTAGNAEMRYDAPVRITGRTPWDFPGLGAQGQVTTTDAALAGQFKGALDDADAMKEKHFIDSIVNGKPINETRQGAESTLSAIMARQAAYTGRTWTWDEVMKHDEVWDAKLNVRAL
jgi:myo-inositol 2-dehydrogenase / D-chiro-inositol 1-dehydrogenase